MRYDYYFTAKEDELEYIEKYLNQIVEETLDRIKNNFKGYGKKPYICNEQ